MIHSSNNTLLILKNTVKHYYLILGITFAIVSLLWFILGFIVPLILGSLNSSGLFGDTFGSVNALFSGLGFTALIYTILLQLQAISDSKRQERFKFLYSILNDIKADFENIRIDNLNGVDCYQYIKKLIHKGIYGHPKLDNKYSYIITCIVQLDDFICLLKDNEKELTTDEYALLKIRVRLMYINYIVLFAEYNESSIQSNSMYTLFIKECKRFDEFIGKQFAFDM